MIEQLLEWDKQLFLLINGMHHAWLDAVMVAVSKTYTWLPLYVLLLYWIYRAYGLRSWMILVAVALVILLSDQITSTLMKPFFGRLRPTWDPSMEGLVHTVNGYRGGTFGFASSHAANTFGIATFLTLLFYSSKRWIPWLYLWCTLVGYSRIYLGVHFPLDIITGGAVGVVMAWLVFTVYRRVAPATPKAG